MTTPDPSPLPAALRELAAGRTLAEETAAQVFRAVMRGEASPAQMAAILVGLRARGETAEEITGAVRALREAMVRLPVDAAGAIDTCGTGGGTIGTFNISTAAAFVVAGAGIPVAKHGNRSFTSRSGSADVLEAMGVGVSLSPERAAHVFDAAGIVFLFAPEYHPAMRHVGPVRRELAVPTIMNLVGPLSNPAGVTRQVVGVAERSRAPLVAGALARLGTEHALVVHGEVGMDEISPHGGTAVWEVRGGDVREWRVEPAALGIPELSLAAIAGGEPAENAARIELVLNGERDDAWASAILLNAAAAIYVSGRARTLAEGLEIARTSLHEGAAAAALEKLRVMTRG